MTTTTAANTANGKSSSNNLRNRSKNPTTPRQRPTTPRRRRSIDQGPPPSQKRTHAATPAKNGTAQATKSQQSQRKKVDPDTVTLRLHTASFMNSGMLLTLLVVLPLVALMLYLTSLPDEQAQQWMRNLDSSLGVRMEERSYSDSCDWDSFLDKLDPFVLAHGVGWFLMCLCIRDFWWSCVLFTVDELLEMWWQSSYANFSECWWDSVVLDMFLTNMLGALLAMVVIWVYKWPGPDYRWPSLYTHSSARDKLLLGCQFVSSLVYKVCAMYAMFGFKSVLWVPVAHWLNVWHLIAYCMILSQTARALYGRIRFQDRKLWHYLTYLLQWLLAVAGCALATKMGYGTPIWDKLDVAERAVVSVGVGSGAGVVLASIFM